MTGIVEFLTARLDELGQRLDYWEQRYAHICLNTGPETDQWWDADIELPIAAIRADVAAKRRIIELHRPIEDKSWLSGEPNNWLWCTSCGSTDDRPVAYPCDTLRLLTQPYADHPDFDPAWSVA